MLACTTVPYMFSFNPPNWYCPLAEPLALNHTFLESTSASGAWDQVGPAVMSRWGTAACSLELSLLMILYVSPMLCREMPWGALGLLSMGIISGPWSWLDSRRGFWWAITPSSWHGISFPWWNKIRLLTHWFQVTQTAHIHRGSTKKKFCPGTHLP